MNKTFEKQLIKAAAAGDDEEVRRLIPLADAKNNKALQGALEIHSAACVEMLLPVSDLSDPSEMHGMLIWAVESLDTAIVKLLVGVCDPKFNNSYPLQLAVLRDYTTIADMLFPVSAPREALERLQKTFPKGHNRGGVIEDRIAKFQEQVERFESEQQREVLNGKVNRESKPTKRKQKI